MRCLLTLKLLEEFIEKVVPRLEQRGVRQPQVSTPRLRPQAAG